MAKPKWKRLTVEAKRNRKIARLKRQLWDAEHALRKARQQDATANIQALAANAPPTIAATVGRTATPTTEDTLADRIWGDG